MSHNKNNIQIGEPIFYGSLSCESTDWNLCFICQMKKGNETLTCPARSKRKDTGSGYSSLANLLKEFYELGQLSQNFIGRINEGNGIEATLTEHEASWHANCRLIYSSSKLGRAKKRSLPTGSSEDSELKPKRIPLQKENQPRRDEICFFCAEVKHSKKLHRASTFNVDSKVRDAAKAINDTNLLGRLSEGDMVALDAAYHAQCLANLYNKARSMLQTGNDQNNQERCISGIVFAELVAYIEESRMATDVAPVFKLAHLASLYQKRLEQCGIQEHRVHSTRLKERLINYFPNLQAHRSGRDMLLVFEEDIGAALSQLCHKDEDDTCSDCKSRSGGLV